MFSLLIALAITTSTAQARQQLHADRLSEVRKLILDNNKVGLDEAVLVADEGALLEGYAYVAARASTLRKNARLREKWDADDGDFKGDEVETSILVLWYGLR